MKQDNRKHKNYELLNLIGYGLAKFGNDFVEQFECKSKKEFYEYIINIGICETIGTVKNRQDMLDPFFNNGRKGWWQRKAQYISRKHFIDSLFGNEDVNSFAEIVKLYIKKDFELNYDFEKPTSPVIKSKFKQLQETGIEAELFFYHNFQSVNYFKNGSIQDARLLGDGYDYQIELENLFYLVEVKGVRQSTGSFRVTKNEYEKAIEFNNNYFLAIVSNLIESPKITVIPDPINNVKFTASEIISKQTYYVSENLKW